MKKTLLILSTILVSLTVTVQAATIDLLVLYGGNAKKLVDEHTSVSIETYINYIIDSANDIYAANGLDVTLNPVAIDSSLAAYDPVPSESWINAVIGWRTAQNLRKYYKADMVVVIGAADGGSCGIAALGTGSNGQLSLSNVDRAYSISAIECGVKTFVHELGHNMGLGHSIAQGSTGGVFDYGVGHGIDGIFTTIMAYPQAYANAPRLTFFSNPEDYRCEGYACGVDYQADSIRALQPVIDTVAAYSYYLD